MRSFLGDLLVVLLFAVTSMIGACAPGPEDCRYDPWCGGGIGGVCDSDGDCFDGFCCDTDNCGGGMCTYDCDEDSHCPPSMLCEHHVCFFTCDSDRDCAPEMSCEHGDTICEWD